MTILNRINRMVLEHGRVVNDSILSVDTLLNHRIDYAFSAYCGDALAHLVKGQPVDVILTAEASGISVAVFMAIVLNNEQWPHPAAVVFAKKSRPVTLAEDGFYVINSYSRTKERPVQLFLGKHVIAPGARVFIVDDFMARGTTMSALGDLVLQAGAQIVGFGAVIEKVFENGRQELQRFGAPVHALVQVTSLAGGRIHLAAIPEAAA
ncbi:phosphoribosyltransferase family protein [Candidatus Amarolinea aalborgensis]|jgi:xanthine phosphoribosyltransferase|uniref:phosphoribosyltransferase family protein n=1 Tax=Candidatus Amarolinea aalborgensis TaxID=2249329 RepID=UPI003BFA21E0